MRFMMAFLAMLGAMWAAVDLHQHDNGWQQPAQCAVCSLEEFVAHGFALQATVQAVTLQLFRTAETRRTDNTPSSCADRISIRAPPFA